MPPSSKVTQGSLAQHLHQTIFICHIYMVAMCQRDGERGELSNEFLVHLEPEEYQKVCSYRLELQGQSWPAKRSPGNLCGADTKTAYFLRRFDGQTVQPGIYLL